MWELPGGAAEVRNRDLRGSLGGLGEVLKVLGWSWGGLGGSWGVLGVGKRRRGLRGAIKPAQL